MGRSACCSKDSVNRGAWSAYEDSLLTKYIEAHGEGRWRSLPKKAGLKRCGKSCRLRWLNYLRPNIKRGNISADEQDLIIRMHSLLGNRWSLIAGRLPGRTDNEIKNYCNTYLSKKLDLKRFDQKICQPVLDSHDDNEAKAAKVMAPKYIKPMNSKWAARSRSVALHILSDNDQKIDYDFAQQSDLIYDHSVLDNQCNFLPHFPAQINNDPSFYTSPSDFVCSNTLMTGPADNLLEVEVISPRCLDEMIISCPPEAPNVASVDQLQFDSVSVDQLQFDSVSLFNSACDFSQPSDMPESGNDISHFNTPVPELHQQAVMANVNIDCPLQVSADQTNNNISNNTSLHVMAPSHDSSASNVHTDHKSRFEEVLDFLEAEMAEKEICFNRLKHDWEQNHAQHLEADATPISCALMAQLHWDGHEPLHIHGDRGSSCSLDYVSMDGSLWGASVWH